MDPLKRVWDWLAARSYIFSFVITIASVMFLFHLNAQAREERTLQLCYSSVFDGEKLIIVAAQDPEPDDPTDENLLQVFRDLTKQGLPEVCQPKYEEMRKRAVKQLEKGLREALR